MAHRFSSRCRPASAPGVPTSSQQFNETQAQHEKPQHDALFGCLLLPHFPVWAARYVNPTLKTSPLLIHRKGRVLAACPLALACNVRIGWPLARANSLCPTAVLKADSPCEVAYVWSEVLAALHGLVPRLESVRPGLLFFEPPSPGSPAWLSTMAALSRLARQWNAQISLAPDRTTAELAAHIVAAGMIRRITNSTGFLQQTPSALLTKLGLSLSATERLDWFGFGRVADLNVLTREQLASQFADPTAPRDAALLWRFASAGTPQADRDPVQNYVSPSVCRSRLVLAHAATCLEEWEPSLGDAVQQATAQLNGLRAGVLSLQLETNKGPRIASKILREPLSNVRSLLRVAREQALEVLKTGDEVKAVEILLSQLMNTGQEHPLFEVRNLAAGWLGKAASILSAQIHDAK